MKKAFDSLSKINPPPDCADFHKETIDEFGKVFIEQTLQ